MNVFDDPILNADLLRSVCLYAIKKATLILCAEWIDDETAKNYNFISVDNILLFQDGRSATPEECNSYARWLCSRQAGINHESLTLADIIQWEHMRHGEPEYDCEPTLGEIAKIIGDPMKCRA